MVDRSLLNKATSPDETPTPGYMFGEIAKATFADINASQQLADYLLKKLERDNPHVKLKVLRIIRHVCDQGKMDFRRAVQKKADLVKQCQQYRGTPDPLKGDAPNKAVREEADAALKSIFSSDASIDAFGRSIDQGRKMQGFGSGDTSSNTGGYGGGGNSFGGGGGMGGSSFGGSGPNSAYGGGGGGPAGKKMEGFGNGPPPPEDMGQGVGAVKEVFNSTVSAISKWTSKAYGTPNSPPSLEETTGAYRAPNIQNDHAYGGGGGGGGGFGAGVQGRFGPSGQTSQPLSQQRPAPQHSTGDYEARVVGELCAPGGARVAPTPAVLEDFCRKCESLDAASVGDQLRQKLQGTEWQTRLKALHAIEALHNNSMDGIVGHLVDHASDLIFEAQEIPQCRQKASKVLYLMGLVDQPDEAPAKPRSGAGAAPAPAPSTMDLLDMDAGDSGVPAPAPAASQAPSDDLLGGGGLLGDSSQASAPQADVPGNDLGGLTLTDDAPPPATTDASSGPSLLATLQGQAQAQPSQATDSQMLGELNMGGGADASQQQQPPSLLGQLNGACNTYQAPNMTAPPPQPMDNQRGSHLNVLSGGPGMGPGMMQGSPGMMMPNMQSGPCYPCQMQQPQMQQQNFGVPYGQAPLGQGMPCQQPGPCSGMYPGVGGGMGGCNMGGGMAPPMGPAMMSPGMMQPGMQQCGGQCGGMGGPCGGPMQQPSGFGQPFGQSGPAGGPSSAFGFVGGAAGSPQGQPQSCPGLCGQGCASTGLNSRPANDNNAFSFVADEMRRS